MRAWDASQRKYCNWLLNYHWRLCAEETPSLGTEGDNGSTSNVETKAGKEWKVGRTKCLKTEDTKEYSDFNFDDLNSEEAAQRKYRNCCWS